MMKYEERRIKFMPELLSFFASALLIFFLPVHVSLK